MKIVIVPKSLENDINKALDEAYKDYPEASVDREQHYQTLLNFFDENGYLPEFRLNKIKKE